MELDFSIAQSILLSVVLGFMIGLQREMTYYHRKSDVIFTGARSFSIITLLGFFTARFKGEYLGLSITFAAIFGALIVGSYIIRALRHEKSGTTTELAAIAAFIVGMLVYEELYVFATFTAVIVVVLLETKARLTQFKDSVKKKEVQSTVLFLIITFVILPVLPNEPIDPYEIINPYVIWLMVILISGLSFIGYIAARIVGVSKGTLVAGFFGGFFSSTATTISFSKKVDKEGKTAKQLAAAIAIACTTMYIRVVILTFVIDPDIAREIAAAFVLATIVGYIYIYYLYKSSQKVDMDIDLVFKNPLDMKEALKFGLLFGVIFGATSLLQEWAGDFGIYISALFSGLTDVDAITLSLSNLYTDESLQLKAAVIGIVIATFSNSFTKLAISFVAGNRILGKYMSIAFALPLMTIVVVLSLQYLIF
ncbi:MAG: MgtC/SapB family protein [Campylobacterota bacterium]